MITVRIIPCLTLFSALLSSGCGLWSQDVKPETEDRILSAVPQGSRYADAEGRLAAMDFSCINRKGPHVDESGREYPADHLLECTKRPGTVSFQCNQREKVFVVPSGDTVDRVFVTRGPDCGTR
jgi:hypothetical protein